MITEEILFHVMKEMLGQPDFAFTFNRGPFVFKISFETPYIHLDMTWENEEEEKYRGSYRKVTSSEYLLIPAILDEMEENMRTDIGLDSVPLL
ncbi:MAG: hypothetical protein OEY01_03545 [Desulfobulbaceae bacterium]|nr:hypothetical protein [Desulfobulbaceae bacterium]